MREMKDSGIEWIGEIPKHWITIRIGNAFSIRNERNYLPMEQVLLLSLYSGKGVFPTGEEGTTNRGNHAQTVADYKIVKKNDIVVNIILAWMGSLGISNYNGVVSPAYDVYIPNEEKVVPHYYHYVFRTSGIANECYRYGRGIMMMRWRTYSSEFKRIHVPFPPLEEQQQIADYLDTQCSEIDATAEDIQKEISLLEDYKKSVITEAVTKGLNPDAEMKDSGIEWIGDINQKASLCRLKFFSYMKGRIGWQGLKSEDFIDNGPYCVTGTDFINGKINWDTCYHVSEERYKMDSNIQLKIGDLLVTKDGTIGKLAKVTELPEKACLNSHLLIIRPLNERFTNEYLYYVISSDVFVRYYKYSSTGSTMESLSQEKLGNFIFPVYDLLSQQQIVDYLDSKCSEIDAIIADKKRQLDILAEYKKSFIYEYVTGKKEVPVHE